MQGMPIGPVACMFAVVIMGCIIAAVSRKGASRVSVFVSFATMAVLVCLYVVIYGFTRQEGLQFIFAFLVVIVPLVVFVLVERRTSRKANASAADDAEIVLPKTSVSASPAQPPLSTSSPAGPAPAPDVANAYWMKDRSGRICDAPPQRIDSLSASPSVMQAGIANAPSPERYPVFDAIDLSIEEVSDGIVHDTEAKRQAAVLSGSFEIEEPEFVPQDVVIPSAHAMSSPDANSPDETQTHDEPCMKAVESAAASPAPEKIQEADVIEEAQASLEPPYAQIDDAVPDASLQTPVDITPAGDGPARSQASEDALQASPPYDDQVTGQLIFAATQPDAPIEDGHEPSSGAPTAPSDAVAGEPAPAFQTDAAEPAGVIAPMAPLEAAAEPEPTAAPADSIEQSSPVEAPETSQEPLSPTLQPDTEPLALESVDRESASTPAETQSCADSVQNPAVIEEALVPAEETQPPAPAKPEISEVDSLLMKAESFKSKGMLEIAAKFYREAATKEQSSSRARSLRFTELNCYIKLQDKDMVRALVDELRSSTVLTKAERMKLQAAESILK